MMSAQLRADMVVSEVLEKWPETAKVFNDFKTACVGCAMSPFDTLADVAAIYEFDLEHFMSALRCTIRGEENEIPYSTKGGSI